MSDAGFVIAFDTATAATVVGVARAGLPDGAVVTRRHDPGPGERPGHATQLLALLEEALADAGGTLREVTRIGVGLGPGSFTGLRIGVATGHGLVQATGAEAVAVSTLDALAWGAVRPPAGPVLAVVDARRGEAFAAAWDAGERTLDPIVAQPDALGALGTVHAAGGPAVGDGAVRYREQLREAGIDVPADESPAHRVDGAALVALAVAGEPVSREWLTPHYLRVPDVDLRPR